MGVQSRETPIIIAYLPAIGLVSCYILATAERRGTPVLLSASVSDNFGNSPQIAAP